MNQTYLNQLAAQIKAEGLDALLIAPSPDLSFLIGHSPMHCYRFQGLFIDARGEYFYVCNLLTAGEMQKYLPSTAVYDWHDNDGFIETVRKALTDHGLLGKKIGVNKHVRAFNILEISQAMDVHFVSAKDLCADVRIRKSEEEIACMRQAARFSEKAFLMTLDTIHPGMTEGDVANNLIRYTHELGGEAAAAMIISGENCGDAHYIGNSRVLKKGDTLILDFGCAYKGLRTDITRTIFLGSASDRQKKLYELVREANQAAEDRLIRGERWIPNIDAAARDIITQAGYGKAFTTRLGHGIGYMGHESPDIKGSHKRMLEPGMCFSIEPGIYLSGDTGIRIEDCVAINSQGEAVVLTDGLTKELCIIDF